MLPLPSPCSDPLQEQVVFEYNEVDLNSRAQLLDLMELSYAEDREMIGQRMHDARYETLQQRGMLHPKGLLEWLFHTRSMDTMVSARRICQEIDLRKGELPPPPPPHPSDRLCS